MVIHHVNVEMGGPGILFPYVACFLTLSGYLVLNSRTNSRGTGHFLWKRFLRIWPALLCGFGLVAYFHPEFFWKFVSESFWIPKPTGFWTITLEEALYLVLAALYVLGLYRHKIVPWIGFFVSMAAYLLLPRNLPGEWIYFGMLVPMFFVGNLIYLYRTKIHWSPWLALPLALISIPLLSIHTLPPFCYVLGQVALAIPLIWLALYATPLLKFVERLGDASYSLFLYHWPLMTAIHYYNPTFGAKKLFLATWVVSALLAYASWHLMEKQALKLKNWRPFAPKSADGDAIKDAQQPLAVQES